MLVIFLFIIMDRVASFDCSISFSPDKSLAVPTASEPTSETEYAVPKVKCHDAVG